MRLAGVILSRETGGPEEQGGRVAHTWENQRTKASRMEARAELWELPREPEEGRGGEPLLPSGLIF